MLRYREHGSSDGTRRYDRLREFSFQTHQEDGERLCFFVCQVVLRLDCFRLEFLRGLQPMENPTGFEARAGFVQCRSDISTLEVDLMASLTSVFFIVQYFAFGHPVLIDSYLLFHTI